MCPCVVKEEWKVLRGIWYEIVGDKWYPFVEADCERIEEQHFNMSWRLKVGSERTDFF